MELIKKIRAFILKNRLIEEGERVVIGFSGGPDSVFLLEVLLKLREEFSLELSLAHINHLLRGEESDGDEAFVRAVAKRLNIPCFVRRQSMKEYAKAHRIGEEEAGREIRYTFFNEVAEKIGADKVALAHNLDDEIETFMFRLMRGTSLKGLEGIPVRRERYVRPILNLYKGEIMEYLHKNNIEYRIDSSNLKADYTRNSIRLDLIPEIEEKYNRNFKEKIANLMEEIGEVNSILKVDYRRFLREDALEWQKIEVLTDYEKRKILNSYLTHYGVEVSRKKLDSILAVMKSGGSKELSLGKKMKLKKEYNKLYVSVDSENCIDDNLQVELKVPGEARFGRYRVRAVAGSCSVSGRESFAADIPTGSILKIRRRQPGDRITISDKGATKKLKEIFINNKIPKEAREEIPIVTLEEEIVWIAGVRGNERYRVRKPDENSIKLIVEEGNFSERGEE